MPDQVTPGLTVFSQIAMEGTIAKIAKFTNSSYLDLIAIIPLSGGFSEATVSATLINNTPTGNFEMKELALTWKSTSADSGSISLLVDALINIPASGTINNQAQSVEIGGQGTFTYGTSESLSLTLFLHGATDAGWVNPFGIPNLTTSRDWSSIFRLRFRMIPSAEGITILLGGTIDVGSGGDVVELTAGGAFDDFEVPTFVYASLSAPDKTKMVSLANLLDAFLPELDATAFPLLNNISFADLSFYACAAPQLFEGKTYQPGIGITGDIDFYGYDLDFAFSLTTAPKVAVQARGSISDNGGPIVITGAGITWISIGGAGGRNVSVGVYRYDSRRLLHVLARGDGRVLLHGRQSQHPGAGEHRRGGGGDTGACSSWMWTSAWAATRYRTNCISTWTWATVCSRPRTISTSVRHRSRCRGTA